MRNVIASLFVFAILFAPHVVAVECDPTSKECNAVKWPKCVASQEVCDGKDNDCDKKVDEGSVCGGTPIDPELPGLCGHLPDKLPNGQLDSDGDDVPDSIDNCPCTKNLDQTDSNNNGIGDACEEEIPEYDWVVLIGGGLTAAVAMFAFRKK